MKNLLLILLIATFTLSCDNSNSPDASYDDIYNCLPIPPDIPTEYANGTPIEWDCETQSFYNNGDLILIYDDNGGLTAIVKDR